MTGECSNDRALLRLLHLCSAGEQMYNGKTEQDQRDCTAAPFEIRRRMLVFSSSSVFKLSELPTVCLCYRYSSFVLRGTALQQSERVERISQESERVSYGLRSNRLRRAGLECVV